VRERLVVIGTSAFSERGYADVTVDDVCRSADIAKGSFYRQFASKEELFLAVAEQVALRSAAEFLGWADGRSVTAEEAVPALAEAMGAHLVVVLDMTSLATQRRPGYAEALHALTATVCDAVSAVLARPDGRPPSPAPPLPTVDAANEVVARAVFEGVRRVVSRDLLPAREEPANGFGALVGSTAARSREGETPLPGR
jgi:AcrR family transcriptional regulator